MKTFQCALEPFISMKHTSHTVGLKIRKKACCNDHTEAITISYCRKLHVLQPSYHCNSMIENICNKFAVKHQLKGNFCLRKSG